MLSNGCGSLEIGGFMSSHRSPLTVRFLAMVLAASLGGWILSSGCGGGGGAAAAAADAVSPAALTTDQTNAIGTAAINLALNTMTDAMTAIQANVSTKSVANQSNVLKNTVEITAATSCDQVDIGTCDSPISTTTLTVTGDVSGECTGTLSECTDVIVASLLCTDFATQDAPGTVFNGTISMSQSSSNGDIGPSASAVFTAVVDGVSYDVSAAFTTSVGVDDVTITGCVTVDAIGLQVVTTTPVSTFGGGGSEGGNGETPVVNDNCSGTSGSACTLNSATFLVAVPETPTVERALVSGEIFEIDTNDYTKSFKFGTGGIPPAAGLEWQTCVWCSQSSDFSTPSAEVNCHSGEVNATNVGFWDFGVFKSNYANIRGICFGDADAMEGLVYFKVEYRPPADFNVRTDEAFGLYIRILP